VPPAFPQLTVMSQSGRVEQASITASKTDTRHGLLDLLAMSKRELRGPSGSLLANASGRLAQRLLSDIP
jgi:hypothetical protein